MNTRLPYLPAGLLLAALLVVGLGCSGADEASSQGADDEPAQRERQVRVETLRLQPSTFHDFIELTGSVESLSDATLSAQAGGTVEDLAERGARVEAGEVVARLDQGTARAAVQQAEAQVETAQAQSDLAQDTYDRQEPLYRDSIISASEFESVRAQRNQARAGLTQARAGLAQAQEQLKHTTVRAPFEGVVEERFVEAGEQISPGQPVARVVNTNRVRITAGVPERYANDIERGSPVRINLSAYGGEPLEGRVTFVGSAIDPNSRTFPIEIELANPEGTLKPEMVAQLRIEREQLEDALVVPRTAVLRDEEGTKVFVVSRENGRAAAAQRTVETGPAYGGRIVIERGLDAGDEVIVLGQTNLSPDDAVNVAERYERLDEAGKPMKDATAQEDTSLPSS